MFCVVVRKDCLQLYTSTSVRFSWIGSKREDIDQARRNVCLLQISSKRRAGARVGAVIGMGFAVVSSVENTSLALRALLDGIPSGDNNIYSYMSCLAGGSVPSREHFG